MLGARQWVALLHEEDAVVEAMLLPVKAACWDLEAMSPAHCLVALMTSAS
jgi:hypothetical protein